MITLQDAKNRFSAIVEAALADRPQEVLRRGKPAVVVVSAEEYHRLIKAARVHRESFTDHLLAFPGLEEGQQMPNPVMWRFDLHSRHQRHFRDPVFAADLRTWLERTVSLFADRILDFAAQDALVRPDRQWRCEHKSISWPCGRREVRLCMPAIICSA
ncbi:type II toxin-antitoxin system prevent-host-death family antitoxin [uncultured Roseibium sp.]|uniref:type II toxin-antitoxin system prevent-host-death family antitoxin n=1 Tax=uncultured Roseibium sp. TaxID=1936171 RepID=UPI003216C2FE